MAKPDKIDLIFQLILAICDFGIAETPSFDLRKLIKINGKVRHAAHLPRWWKKISGGNFWWKNFV